MFRARLAKLLLWGGFLLTPAALYPVAAMGWFAADHLWGDRIFVHSLLLERRVLWDMFWGDYLAALPVGYLLCAVLVMLELGLRRLVRLSSMLWLPVLGALMGLAAGLYFSRGWGGAGTLVLVLTGATVATPLALFMAALRRGHGGAP